VPRLAVEALPGPLARRLAIWATREAAGAMAARRTAWRRFVGRLARRPFVTRIAGDGRFNVADVEDELSEQAGVLAEVWAAAQAHEPGGSVLLGCRLERPRRSLGPVRPDRGEEAPVGRFEIRFALGSKGAGTVLVFEARPRRDAEFERLSRWLAIRGARTCPHYRGTLHDHLMRTFALLGERGLPAHVRLAGGLHSVHGTSLLAFALLADDAEPEVAAEFGEAPARLARLFSVLDRPAALDEPLSQSDDLVEARGRDGAAIYLAADDFAALRWMECANLADQGTLGDFPNLAALWKNGGPADAFSAGSGGGQLSATPSNRPTPKVTAAAR
jgi:hypothetical protein